MAHPAREPIALPAPARADAGSVRGLTHVRRWWLRFARNRGAVFGLAVFVGILLMAVFADVLVPFDPLVQGVGPANAPPSWAHWAGTDSFGRDMLSRIIYGSRVALMIGIVAVLVAMVIGVVLGLIAGYYGGLVDAAIMRVMDGLFAFPVIILAIAMMAVMGFGVTNVIIAVAVGFVAPFARVTRGDVLAVKEEPYIEAARLAGALQAKAEQDPSILAGGAGTPAAAEDAPAADEAAAEEAPAEDAPAEAADEATESTDA